MMFSNLHRRYNVRESFMDSTSIVRSLICKLDDVLVVGLTSFYHRSTRISHPFRAVPLRVAAAKLDGKRMELTATGARCTPT